MRIKLRRRTKQKLLLTGLLLAVIFVVLVSGAQASWGRFGAILCWAWPSC